MFIFRLPELTTIDPNKFTRNRDRKCLSTWNAQVQQAQQRKSQNNYTDNTATVYNINETHVTRNNGLKTITWTTLALDNTNTEFWIRVLRKISKAINYSMYLCSPAAYMVNFFLSTKLCTKYKYRVSHRDFSSLV